MGEGRTRAGGEASFLALPRKGFCYRPLRLAWWESDLARPSWNHPRECVCKASSSGFPGSLLCPVPCAQIQHTHTHTARTHTHTARTHTRTCAPCPSRSQKINSLRQGVGCTPTEMEAASVSNLVLPRDCCWQTQGTERGFVGS